MSDILYVILVSGLIVGSIIVIGIGIGMISSGILLGIVYFIIGLICLLVNLYNLATY